jgi:hypothetical protein
MLSKTSCVIPRLLVGIAASICNRAFGEQALYLKDFCGGSLGFGGPASGPDTASGPGHKFPFPASGLTHHGVYTQTQDKET